MGVKKVIRRAKALLRNIASLRSERKASDLRVGDTILAKQGGKVYKIVKIEYGIMNRPLLTLQAVDGGLVDSDTYWDSFSATYTVIS